MDARYPDEWESDVVLADGGTVHLRPIRPDDDARMALVTELDCNPVTVGATGAIAVDVELHLARPVAPPAQGLRRLRPPA